MIRFVLIGILVLIAARMFWRLVDSIIEGAGGGRSRGRTASSAVRLVRDPVCGTFVSSQNSFALTAGGATHHFCSEQCRAEYQRRA